METKHRTKNWEKISGVLYSKSKSHFALRPDKKKTLEP